MGWGSCYEDCFGSGNTLSRRKSTVNIVLKTKSFFSPYGLCYVIPMMQKHPDLQTKDTLGHPSKTLSFMRKVDVDAMNSFMDAVSKDVLHRNLPIMYREVKRPRFGELLAPLVNDVSIHSSIFQLMALLCPEDMAFMINEVNTNTLLAVMTVKAPKLLSVMSTVTRKAIRDPMTKFILQQPTEEVIVDKLIPVMNGVKDSRRLGWLVNNAAPASMIEIMCCGEPQEIIEFIDLADEADFQPGGRLINFLEAISKELDLIGDKVVPLLESADMKQVVPFLQRIRVEQMMCILRCNDAVSIVKLVENADLELSGALTDIRLEDTTAVVAKHLAKIMTNQTTSKLVKSSTAAMGKAIRKVKSAARHGKRERGAGTADDTTIQDVARGLVSKVVQRGQKASGRERTGFQDYRFGDFTRGLVSSISFKRRQNESEPERFQRDSENESEKLEVAK